MADLNLRRFDITSMKNPEFLDCPAGWYFGEVMRNKRHGQGMFFWPGGEAYMGGWNNDSRSGFGIQRDSTGGMQIGTWHRQRLTGWGVEFEYVSPTIKFYLPKDEEFLDAFGKEQIFKHRDWFMETDGDFGFVYEGMFRGGVSNGYGTAYFRDRKTGIVDSWQVGPHAKNLNLDGYGVKHNGMHPRFLGEHNEAERLDSVQGEYINDELQMGPATHTISYWLRDVAIQVIEINGTVDVNGYFEDQATISVDGDTIWSGRVWRDVDLDKKDQIFDILSEDDVDMIYTRRLNTIQAILEGGEDIQKYDVSAIVPTFADMTPAPSWVMDVMVSQSKQAIEIKGAEDAEKERLDAGKLEYTNRFFITDEDGDNVGKHDGINVNNGKLNMFFDLPFTPIFISRTYTDDDDTTLKMVSIKVFDKTVGTFRYNAEMLNINTDEMEITKRRHWHDDEGIVISLPISDSEGEFKCCSEVEQDYVYIENHMEDVLTREETKALEDAIGAEDQDPNMETMDVERDEDGNITGLGSSDPGNIKFILNAFKNGAGFAPIDEIVEKAKRTK